MNKHRRYIAKRRRRQRIQDRLFVDTVCVPSSLNPLAFRREIATWQKRYTLAYSERNHLGGGYDHWIRRPTSTSVPENTRPDTGSG